MPFGPRAASLEADASPASPLEPPPSPESAAPRAEVPPPSAEDFWGEQSAAIQSALRAPVVGEDVDRGSPGAAAIQSALRAPAVGEDVDGGSPGAAAIQSALRAPAVGEDADGGSPGAAAIQSALRAPAVGEDADRGSAGAAAIRPGRVDRRAVAGIAAVMAIAAVAVIALASSAFGPGGTPERAPGSKAGLAAVLSGGVSSVFRLDLRRVHVARVATAKARRTPHRPPAPKPDHKIARPRVTLPLRSSVPVVSAPAPAYHPPTTDTSYSTGAGGTDTHADTPPATRSSPPRSASQPVASRATVSATGESGALGPIQSPNG